MSAPDDNADAGPEVGIVEQCCLSSDDLKSSLISNRDRSILRTLFYSTWAFLLLGLAVGLPTGAGAAFFWGVQVPLRLCSLSRLCPVYDPGPVESSFMLVGVLGTVARVRADGNFPQRALLRMFRVVWLDVLPARERV